MTTRAKTHAICLICLDHGYPWSPRRCFLCGKRPILLRNRPDQLRLLEYVSADSFDKRGLAIIEEASREVCNAGGRWHRDPTDANKDALEVALAAFYRLYLEHTPPGCLPGEGEDDEMV